MIGELSWEDIKTRTYFGRPHVVILGAGASRAAFPSGDKYGRLLPLMNDLAATLDLGGPLRDNGLDPTTNFESIYDEIARREDLAELRSLVEYRVQEYFSSLRLPDEPTIYDYLVLSLRSKDYIATFNWDPFLYLACWRNHQVAELPTELYLHGCAVVGHCLDDRTMGAVGSTCSVCKRPFTPSRLLYPVGDKDYRSDPFIDAQWKSLQFAMEHAWLFTIFGYSAPSSDAAAIELLDGAWGGYEKRNLEEIELINTQREEELLPSWDRFIHTHHYRVTNDYFKSLLGAFPRRTCEAMWEQNMEARFLEYRSVPRFESVNELQAWASELASYEPDEQDETA